ncbi:MAG: 50S ribosomal protein L11 methyltransferase [Clostridia bacterium]|nr:50S ribosomal protein L11 methyltransferase [Clostridia bacterium]
MDWVEVTVRTNTHGVDMVSELLMRHGAKGTSVEDRFDTAVDSECPGRWDLLDPSVVEAMDQDALVRAYLPEDAGGRERLALFVNALSVLTPDSIGFDAGSLTVSSKTVRDEDWAESWKQYYKPFRVGERLVVKPVWETFAENPGDIVLEIDPGPAFGNGSHETTAMCMMLMEQTIRPGDTVLDVGTGSGILALAAAGLGASRVFAIDLDPVAVRVASENIERNGFADIAQVCVGDLLRDVDCVSDLVVANIIADAVIRLASTVRGRLKPGGTYIASGIIRERERDVLESIQKAGFKVSRVERQGEWVAISARTEV